MLKDLELKQRYFSCLNERHRRLYAALEAEQYGKQGVQLVSEAFGIHPHTIRAGRRELRGEVFEQVEGVRRRGGGRKKKSGAKPAV